MINQESRLRALEIAADVVEEVENNGPSGLRYIDGARIFAMDYHQFYQLAIDLSALGYVKIGRGIDGHRNRMLLPHWEEPAAKALTDKQREVLEYLCSIADGHGIASASYKQIARATSCACPYFALDRLDRKGFLNFIDLGGPTRAASFKIYPNGDGASGDSWWALKYGRLPMIDIAEQFKKENQGG